MLRMKPLSDAASPLARLAPADPGLADAAVDGPQARASFGVTGAGIKIGILSDSYHVDGTEGPPATILKEGPPGSTDEGRALAQLISATAPDAQFYFYSAYYSEQDFAAGITALAAAGCQIIVDDIGYPDEPFYQIAGPIDDAVAQAVAQGVNYFTAVGNEGDNFYEGRWQPGGTVVQSVLIPAGISATLALQWDAPYNSASPPTLTATATSADGLMLPSFQTNGEPDALIDFPVLDQPAAYPVTIAQTLGTTAPSLFKDILVGGGRFTSAGSGVGSGAVFGQPMVPGVNAVGAVAARNTPAEGGTPIPEFYSSTGPGELLFAPDGTRLAQPQTLDAPSFLAPDGAGTEAINPFYGTSAAAAEAAAVAALMLQANPSLTNADLSALLADSAIPAGAASVAGAGLIRADVAVDYAKTGTIFGSEQPTLRGFSQAHTMAGGAGAHLIAAGSGAALLGSEGTDTVLAGTGADTVDLTGPAALVFGNTGALLVRTLNGADTVVGSTGAMTVAGGTGGGLIWGGTGGDDLLTAGDQPTILVGQAAGDTLVAAPTGNDTLFAIGTGPETLVGNGGASNRFQLGDGSVVAFTGPGGATVGFGRGAATVVAGPGADHFEAASGQTGREAIFGFDPAQDSLLLAGYGAAGPLAVADQSQQGGSTYLALPDGASLAFLGLPSLPGGAVSYA
jgi:hypothetical protein